MLAILIPEGGDDVELRGEETSMNSRSSGSGDPEVLRYDV